MDNLLIIKSRFGNDCIEELGLKKPHLRFNCPFCQKKRGKADKGYRLYVNVNNFKFYCFKCHSRGIVKTVSYGSSSLVYNRLFDLFIEKHKESSDDPNVFYVPNKKIRKGTVAYEYLINRGIDDYKIERYNIRLGIDREFGRVVIPNILYSDEWTDMFSARSYLKQEPKYLNPEGAVKTNSVFNIEHIKDGDDIDIVEGVITSICAGERSVGVYGSSPSDAQLELILSKNPKSINCVMDEDAYKKNEELAERLSVRGYKGTLNLVYMPNGIDAADLGEKRFREYVNDTKIKFTSSKYRNLISYVKRKDL